MDDIEEVDERSHAQLTAAISKLDKVQHIKTPSRNEPTTLTSEFDLIKTNRLDVGGLVSVLENSAQHVEIGKSIKKTHAPDKVLPKPLEKPQAERIKRSTAFESTRKKLERWDATVARNRTVDHISFPLKIAENKLIPTKEYLSKLKLKSELERELDAVEGREDLPLEEEEDKYPMTYEEMLEHRKELAKLRAQQSFKAAKAKRQSKIKSKKYHRILKKERMKQQLSEFEELQKTDPEEALRRLESLEKTRAEERHTLRHKNTGKWAKSKLVQAKYNPEVRQQLADQLAVSRSLTQKMQKLDDSSDDSGQEEAIPDLPVSQDPMNPWMSKNSGKSSEEEKFDFGYKKYLKEKFTEENSSSDESVKENNADSKDESQVNAEINLDNYENQDNSVINVDYDHEETAKPIESKKEKNISNKVTSTTEWAVEPIHVLNAALTSKKRKNKDLSQEFDSFESEISNKVQKKLIKMRDEIENISAQSDYARKHKTEERDNLSKLEFKSQKKRPIIDSELTETTHKTPVSFPGENKSAKELAAKAVNIENNDSTANVDPNRFIAAKPKYLATAVSESNDGFNNLDDEEQVVPKVNIEDVFEEDDVVDSFRQEKEEEINKDKPKDVDLSLPGWGSWGGKGVKAPKRKRSRFIFKVPPKLPRRDENKGDIIIKEFKEPKLAAHKVTELPFPFTSLKDFEASIRAPLGNTFIPEIAHRKAIKPSVFTKAGTIIEPMDDDELLKPRNLTFKNQSIIKLLGNK